jgi:hypothetical protein
VTLKNNIFRSKPASRDVEEVPGKFIHPLGIPLAQEFVCQENLLITLIILVGATPRKKVDGTDFGCVSIQS